MSVRGERVSQKGLWVLIGVLVLGTPGALSLWLHDHAALQEARTQIVMRELRPIATLLKENQALLQELQSEPFTEKNSGILESYLAKIRHDGVAKHADNQILGVVVPGMRALAFEVGAGPGSPRNIVVFPPLNTVGSRPRNDYRTPARPAHLAI
jgi:hypothetical protein